MSDRGRAGGSLRRRLVLAAAATTLGVAGVGSALIIAGNGIRSELIKATTALLEEQRIGDAMSQAVMRQLVIASRFPLGGPAMDRAGFLAAGEEVHDRVRRYLFRELAPRERLQIEQMREEHQRLEVAAVRAAELYSRGLPLEGDLALQEASDHAIAFLDGMAQFLGMREADLEALEARQAQLFRTLTAIGAGLALLVLLGSVTMAWGLHRRVARPLADLAAAVDRVGEGDLAVRVPPGHDDEFRRVADGFNRMAENLETGAQRLEGRNRELAAALERLRAAQDDLIQAEKLSAIGRMTAGFAHELNNPLASILGFAQLFAERLSESNDLDPTELADEFLAPILQEAGRAQHLVQNLLHASRSSSTEIGPVALADALTVVVSLRAYAFQQAGLRLDLTVPADLYVVADPQRLHGVLLNLVNNAFDAMAPAGHGTLRVAARQRDSEVEIIVEDEGPGFGALDRVFEPFFTTKPVGGGTGLGLAIVHQSVQAFGGTVTAENRTEGGARVVLRLPVAAPPARERVAPEPAEPSRPVPSPEEPPRILVVEDEELLRQLQRRLLERLPAEVTLAESVAQAREILAGQDFDLVVSDVKMPGESGLDFFQWAERERPELTERFLFVTGDLSGESLLELAERHPDRFVTKPFKVPDYLARVRDLLAVSRAAR